MAQEFPILRAAFFGRAAPLAETGMEVDFRDSCGKSADNLQQPGENHAAAVDHPEVMIGAMRLKSSAGSWLRTRKNQFLASPPRASALQILRQYVRSKECVRRSSGLPRRGAPPFAPRSRRSRESCGRAGGYRYDRCGRPSRPIAVPGPPIRRRSVQRLLAVCRVNQAIEAKELVAERTILADEQRDLCGGRTGRPLVRHKCNPMPSVGLRPTHARRHGGSFHVDHEADAAQQSLSKCARLPGW